MSQQVLGREMSVGTEPGRAETQPPATLDLWES